MKKFFAFAIVATMAMPLFAADGAAILRPNARAVMERMVRSHARDGR